MVKKKDDPGSRNKNEDNLAKEDNLGKYKLIFTPAVSKTGNVRERIVSFQELSVKNECMIGSGSCATHNVKWDKIVDTVRRCAITEDGFLQWRVCDTRRLICPMSNPRLSIKNIRRDTSQSERGTTNQRREFVKVIRMSHSDAKIDDTGENT